MKLARDPSSLFFTNDLQPTRERAQPSQGGLQLRVAPLPLGDILHRPQHALDRSLLVPQYIALAGDPSDCAIWPLNAML